MRTMTSNRGIRSFAAPAAVLAAAALALTACSASGSSGGGSANAGVSPSSASSGAPSSASGSGGTGSSGASAVPSSVDVASTTFQQRSGTGVAACTASQLKVAQVSGDVGAGQYYSTLVFTNASSRTCTLTGYPGVSYVGSNGAQSGNAAVRSGGSLATVTLRPGGKANAMLHDSNGISGYSPQQCQLSPAKGLRIYPPNQKAALFLPWQTNHCAGLSIHPLSIGPVQQG